MNCKIIYFNTVSENDGNLTFIEEHETIPFAIKRVFQIYGIPTQNIARANHASSNTFFVLQIIVGQVSVEIDDGTEKHLHKLNKIDEALLVPPLTWMKTMCFSQDAILQVYASESYQNCKYIEDYTEFKERIHKNEENYSCWGK